MLRKIFLFLCILGMFGSIYRSIHQYLKDKDVTRTKFKRFNNDEDGVAPSMSLCFHNQFIEERLRQFGDGIDSVSYRSFLQGKTMDERMTKIDYDNVTLDINDHLDRVKFVTSLVHMSTV